MTTSHPSVKPKQRFRPNVETLEPRCTPVAGAAQYGNTVVIVADQAVGGRIDIVDNGTSKAGAIQVLSAGIPVPMVGAAAFDPKTPISVGIIGSNKNDTVTYTLLGNLIGSTGNPFGGIAVTPLNSAGRVITADLGTGNTDSFQFNWPSLTATGFPAFASGLMRNASFKLNVADHAQTELLGATLNIAGVFADLSVTLTGGAGVDNLAVQENILDLSAITPIPPGAQAFIGMSNETVVDGSKARKPRPSLEQKQKGSQLLDLPMVTPLPGGSPEGSNRGSVYGNANTTATIPKRPFWGYVQVFGIPKGNIIFV
jgi:hypothetical protein